MKFPNPINSVLIPKEFGINNLDLNASPALQQSTLCLKSSPAGK